jgi:Flp pilus assembly protein protease CpaA
MSTLIFTGLGAALLVAAVAAMCDSHSGTIPNWLTLPPLAAAPIVYGVLFSPELAAQCFFAALVSGFGPYWAFRLGGMGGGDVKLFAALGSVIGFDPFAGLEIQLTAFALALVCALCLLARRGKLLVTLSSFLRKGMRRVAAGAGGREELLTPIRMGWAVLAATVMHVASYFAFSGGGS